MMGPREGPFVKGFAIIVTLALFLGLPSETAAYAVLAHEAIIDIAWDANIRPLLLMRFPDATASWSCATRWAAFCMLVCVWWKSVWFDTRIAVTAPY